MRFREVPVLGYRVAVCTLEEAAGWVLEHRDGPPRLVVTLNPEICVRAEREPALAGALRAADLTVADGVGVVWAARRAGHRLPERVPGVELAARVLERGGPGLRVFLLGARPGVAERAAERIHARWGCEVVGVRHGYFDRREDAEEVCAEVRAAAPQLLLAGLGEGQELFLHAHREALGTPVMIGVGGTLDVLAGEARRTPAWTRRLGLEWAWRVASDPSRWHRAPRLALFALRVLTHPSGRKASRQG